ncbi:hypothetical protein DL98DRAFT_540468 [Cadophora sp. DSE1049]|nr:hypothetical protein DL98DRAFT_540468 [Cadophora sp. DSE1049]
MYEGQRRRMEANIENKQLRAKNESLSAAQKDQRAEVADEKKQTWEQYQEKIRGIQDQFVVYKQDTESRLRDLRSEVNFLVSNIEVLDKRIIQADISSSESRKQRDISVEVRKGLEVQVEQLREQSQVAQRDREKDNKRKRMSTRHQRVKGGESEAGRTELRVDENGGDTN